MDQCVESDWARDREKLVHTIMSVGGTAKSHPNRSASLTATSNTLFLEAATGLLFHTNSQNLHTVMLLLYFLTLFALHISRFPHFCLSLISPCLSPCEIPIHGSAICFQHHLLLANPKRLCALCAWQLTGAAPSQPLKNTHHQAKAIVMQHDCCIVEEDLLPCCLENCNATQQHKLSLLTH